MPRCGWCGNSGFIGGMRCKYCATPNKGYFPGIKSKRKRDDDTLKSGHKHDLNKLLYETKASIWFECSCGHTHKITS